MKNPFLLKEIRSKEGELHFKRYGIKTPWFGIYLHFIYKPDEDKHRHNHPWDHIIFPLKGCYIEEREWNGKVGYLARKFYPWPRWNWRKHNWYHKIHSIIKGPCISLCITGPKKYDWGFNVDGVCVDEPTYRKNKRAGLYD